MNLPVDSNPADSTAIGLKCLICIKDMPFPVKTESSEVTEEIYSEQMEVLCKYMKWATPSKYQFDFKNESFPFCNECVLFVVKLYKLHEQLEETQGEINKVIIGISEKLLLSPRSGKKQVKEEVAENEMLNGENSGPTFKDVIETEEKCKYYRNQIYKRFTPSVRLSEQTSGAADSNIWTDNDSEVSEQPLPVEVKIDVHPSMVFTNDYDDDYPNVEFSNPHISHGFANNVGDVTAPGNDEPDSDLFDHPDKNLTDHEDNVNNTTSEQQTLDSLQPLVSEIIDPLELSSKEIFVHSDLKRNVCSICGKKFFNKYSFQRHQFTHTDDQSFRCDLCEKSFCSAYNLQRHKTLSHDPATSSVTKYTCIVCSQSFNYQRLLTIHRKTHDNISCLICGQNLLKSLFKIHMRSHSTEETFTCVDCNKSFSSCWEFHYHLKNHSKISSSYVCDICGRTFNQKFSMDRHKRTIHNCTMLSEESTQKVKTRQDTFHCEKEIMDTVQSGQYCSDDKTIDAINSEASSSIYFSKNNFECLEYTKSHTSSSDPYHHSMVHAKSHSSNVPAHSQPFDCDVCGRKFAQKFSLKRHKNTIHRTENMPAEIDYRR